RRPPPADPGHAAALGGPRVHQHRGRMGGGAARPVETDRLDRGPAVAELDAEPVGEALVLWQLSAMIGLDPRAREGKRVARPRLAGRPPHRHLLRTDPTPAPVGVPE